jgi:hypothetical protein
MDIANHRKQTMPHRQSPWHSRHLIFQGIPFHPYTDEFGKICPPIAGQSLDLYSPQYCHTGLLQWLSQYEQKFELKIPKSEPGNSKKGHMKWPCYGI